MESLEQIQNFKGKYPKQLWYLFFSEMWERFSFYGMRGMLVFFMVDQLLLNEVDSNLLKCNNLLDVIKVEHLSDEKSKEHVTFSNSSNKRMNGKRTNESIKRRLSKNGNEFGYK